ncbi:hypothetical protein Scep_007147 [Stephania cephalantha]|uniref:Agenet domain-containing protein n=1 Tax=Stephania cephalantha TaxID=152367 RepID=A0AAP0PNJ8_9MAGN
MDYDDNDFQSQGFPLVGEENVKFSPSLQSYSLPKFDLDENLHVHLRYENLVDSEVLLGFQGHEENQWIEDFSRGSSGIEFSSSAPESCSLSRHHNVWSEATSTESVEMLLKSVGQDDLIVGQNIIEDACDEHEILRNQMELNLERDGSTASQIRNTMEGVSTVPHDECLERLSVVGGFADDEAQVEGTRHADGAVANSQGEGSGNMELKGDSCDKETFNEIKQKEECHLIDTSKENKSSDGSTLSNSNPSYSETQCLAVNAGELSNMRSLQLADSFQKESVEKLSQQLVSGEGNQTYVLTGEGSDPKNIVDHLEKPSNLAPKFDSMVSTAEITSVAFSENVVQTSIWEDAVHTDTDMRDQFTGNAKELCIAAGHNPFGVPLSAGISSSSVLNIYPLDQRIIQGSDSAETSGKHRVLPDGYSDRLVGEDPASNKESSISVICESNATENVKDDDSMRIHEAETGAGVYILSSVQAESVERCESKLVESGPGDSQSDPVDISVFGKENSKSSFDTVSAVTIALVPESSPKNKIEDVQHMLSASGGSNVELTDNKDNMKAPFSADCSSNLVSGEESSLRTPSRCSLFVEKESSSVAADPVAVSDIERTLCRDNAGEMLLETVGHSSTLEDNAVVICRNDSHILSDERAAQQCSHESEHQPTIQVSSDGKNDSAALGEMHKVVEEMPLVREIPIGETYELPMMGSLSCDTGQKDVEDNRPLKNNNDGPNFDADTKVNSLNAPESSGRPATLLESEDEFRASEAGSPSLNSSVPNCGSPTIISSSQTSQHDIDYQREGTKSLDQNASLSNDMEGVGKKVGSCTQDRKENVASEDDRSFTFKVGSLEDLSEKETSKGWRPFSNLQSHASDQNIEASATTSISYQIYPDAMQGTSFGSPQNSGRKEIFQSVKNGADDATTPVSRGPMEIETTKEGNHFKDEISQSDGVQKSTCKDTVIDKIDLGVNKVDAAGHKPKENNDFEAVSCGTSEVRSLASLSNKETGSSWKSSSNTQPQEFTQTVVVPSTTSGPCQIDAKVFQEIPHANPRKSSGAKNVRRRSKDATEDKSKNLSSKTTVKETSKGGKTLKELSSPKQTKIRGSNLVVATSTPLRDVIQGGQLEGTWSVGCSKGSSGKPSVIPTVQTSNLPDLNTSAPLFQQPFSDFQQVELRAQIFVYGSLIQGTAPDEACMVSAFGESDGGRSTWELVWRAALERIQGQKSPLSNHEAPVLLHAGAQVPEQATKQSVHHNDPLSTPNRAGNKVPPAGNIYSAMPFSSPLWTISTPYDDSQSSSMLRGTPTDLPKSILPFRPYHSPNLKHYAANTTWHPQAPSGTWVLTPHSTSVDPIVHYPALSTPEAAHVASVRESSVPHPSVVPNVPPDPLTQSGVSSTVPAVTPLELKGMTASDSKHTSDVRTRKRKKVPASMDNSNISSLVQAQTDSVCTGPHLPASISTTAPVTSPSRVVSGNVVPISLPMPSTYYQIVGGHDKEQRVIFSDETSSRIEQAKQQAEDAAAFAASAVKHCQNIWSQLAMQKTSGLVSDNEAKLVSSAVAIAAAASVAKAAAAAARVAADAALQAKLMADEAFVESKSKTPTPDAPLYDGAKNLGIVSPSSILKGRGATGASDSVLVTAREAARKRVEAASAAAKRAENLDGVVKAAEMAAEAVSQAGIIIAMGEPIPLTLTELVEAGPDNYWRTQQKSPGHLVQSKNHMFTERTNVNGIDVGLGRFPLNAKETKGLSGQGQKIYSNEMSQSSVDNQIRMFNETHLDSVTSSKWVMNVQNVCNASDLTKTIGVVPESQVGSMNASMNFQKENYEGHTLARTLEENGIKEGSLVEVLSSENKGVRVWYCAKVLSLKDGKAHVCYTDRIGNEGSGQPSDWVPLEDGDKAPRIRIAHPMSLTKLEGAKKRRRAARGDYAWSVGDKVDAWMKNSWWEGDITEKSKEDETNLTFQFSAQGDTSVVKAWHIRPSLIWENGQWAEWSRSSESNYLNEGDMSQQKPLKRGRHGSEFEPAADTGRRDNESKDLSRESGMPVPSQPLALSAKEKLFTVGRSSKDDKNSDSLRTKRIGLQKGGSRVVFGVPKPGKKRKFMEVSKHYVSDGAGKVNSGNDSMRFSKLLIPQESTSRGWRNTSKVVPKGKQVVEPNPKTAKSSKTQNILSRNVSGKDNSSNSLSSGLHDGVAQDPITNVQGSVYGDEGMPETQKIHEVDHFPKSSTTAETASYSAADTSSEAPPLKKKFSSAVTAEFERKGRTGLPGERVARNDEKNAGQSDNPGKSMSNVVEPRRSSRRIQPTSRLLEGLQSSLIISKIPVIPHDKGTKAQQRTSSRGNNHG